MRTAIIVVIYTCCLGHTLTPYLKIPPPKVCHPDRQKTSHYRGLIQGFLRFKPALRSSRPLSHLHKTRRNKSPIACGEPLLKIPIMKWHRFYITHVCFCASSFYTVPSRKADICLDLLKQFCSFRILNLGPYLHLPLGYLL